MKQALGDCAFLLRLATRQSRGRQAIIILSILWQMAACASPLLVAKIVDAVIHRNPQQSVLLALLLIVLVGGGFLVQAIASSVQLQLTRDVGYAYDEQLAQSVLAIKHVDGLEGEEHAEALTLLSNRQGALGEAYNFFLIAISNILPILTTIIVAGLMDVRILILIPLSIFNLMIARHYQTLVAQGEQRAAKPEATLTAYMDTVTTTRGKEEIAVQSLEAPALVRSFIANSARAWSKARSFPELRTDLLTLASSVVYAAATGLVLYWIAWSAHDVAAISGVLVGSFLLSMQLQEVANIIAMVWIQLISGLRQVRRYRLVSELSTTEDAEQISGSSIRLHDVQYTYPNANRPALSEVCVDLPPASLVAVVGTNGSGKSTLAQVLLGVRRPEEGKLCVPPDKAIIAQYPVRWDMSVEDNVIAGNPRQDAVTLEEAYTSADLGPVIEKLSDGTHTILHSDSLSGGQWQRIAHARCYFAGDVGVRVLDEPTSALDAFAEKALLKTYLDFKDNATTIIITHRLTTALRCDYVLLVENGRILEQGKPRELLAQPSRFAELYALDIADYEA